MVCLSIDEANIKAGSNEHAILTISHFLKAAIGYVADHQIKFQCNGVVISEHFVLTNVHCVESFYPPVIVRLGSVRSKMKFNLKILGKILILV